MIHRLALFSLLAGCVLLGAILFAELASGTAEEQSAIEIAPRAVRLPPVHPQQRHRQAQLVATILGRPLFSPDRRPPAKSADRAQTDSDLANTRLTGIVTLPDLRIAIFAVRQGKPLALKQGETVSGWQIDRITPYVVAISGPGGTRRLRPKADSALARMPTTLGDFAKLPVLPAVRGQPRAVPFRPHPLPQPPIGVGRRVWRP